jgi:hypothetical protein
MRHDALNGNEARQLTDEDVHEQLDDVIGEVRRSVGGDEFRLGLVLERVGQMIETEGAKQGEITLRVELDCWRAFAEIIAIEGDFPAGELSPEQQRAFQEFSSSITNQTRVEIAELRREFGDDGWFGEWQRRLREDPT